MLALMVARLMIHHSGTLGRKHATLRAPKDCRRLAAFLLAALSSSKVSLVSPSGVSGPPTYHSPTLFLRKEITVRKSGRERKEVLLLVLRRGGEFVNDIRGEVELFRNLPSEVLVNFFIMVIITNLLTS